MKILGEMPTYSGHWVKNLSVNCSGRHLLVLPMSRKAIIQYCTKILVNALKVSSVYLDWYESMELQILSQGPRGQNFSQKPLSRNSSSREVLSRFP